MVKKVEVNTADHTQAVDEGEREKSSRVGRHRFGRGEGIRARPTVV